MNYEVPEELINQRPVTLQTAVDVFSTTKATGAPYDDFMLLSTERLVFAARCWEQFAQANPHEAQLIEAGLSVAEALRSTK